jgi:predicted TIM-barrel fold metal-dependent hydrolase
MKVIDYSVMPPTEYFKNDISSEHLENYSRVYKGRSGFGDVEELIRLLDEAEVSCAVIKARDIETTHRIKIPNEHIADLVKKYPNRFIGLAGVDPYKGHQAVEELDHAVKNLGLRGLNLWTFEYNLYPNDKRFYPLYEKCVELNIFISMESSMHFSTKAYMDLCKPIYLDYVAVDFPELTIVGSTPGWPWVSELVGVAWRHPNVYIATSVTRPIYMTKPGMGYEPILQLGNNILQDKIIYGSGFPLLPLKRTVEELKQLPLKEEVKEKWLFAYSDEFGHLIRRNLAGCSD